jgi:hypothetical protein
MVVWRVFSGSPGLSPGFQYRQSLESVFSYLVRR